MKYLIAKGESERGAALVEAAIVLNLLSLLLVGIIAFGVLLGYQQTLIHATSDAARAASVTKDKDEQTTRALAAIDRVLSATSRSCSDVAVSCEVSEASECELDPASFCRTIRVEHDHDIDPVVPRLPLLSAALPHRSSAEVVVTVGGSFE